MPATVSRLPRASCKVFREKVLWLKDIWRKSWCVLNEIQFIQSERAQCNTIHTVRRAYTCATAQRFIITLMEFSIISNVKGNPLNIVTHGPLTYLVFHARCSIARFA